MASLSDSEKVFHPLNAYQRAGIALAERRRVQDEQDPMLLHCASVAFHFVHPDSGREVKWTIQVEIDRDAPRYLATIVDGKGKKMAPTFDAAGDITDILRAAIRVAGEIVARQHRS